jgi:CO dehydrogenase maturation factor
VVAIDGDPNPNLGVALGVGLEETAKLDSVINAKVREDAPDDHEHRTEDALGSEVQDLLDRLGVWGPDGVRLLQAGRIERPTQGCLCCGSHVSFRRLFDELPAASGFVVADLEPGANGLIWTGPSPDDVVIVVTAPYRKSLEVSRRAIQVARDFGVQRVLLAANRLENGDARDVRGALTDIEVIEIPEDAAVTAAAAKGLSVVDTAPDSAAVLAVARLASTLVD